MRSTWICDERTRQTLGDARGDSQPVPHRNQSGQKLRRHNNGHTAYYAAAGVLFQKKRSRLMHVTIRMAAILGFLLGVTAPVFGMFLGLQVSPLLGTIFAFPLVAASWLAGEPIGNLAPWIRVVALLVSGLVCSVAFASLARAATRRHPQSDHTS